MHIPAFFITPQTGLTTALSKVAVLTVGFRGFRTSIFNELEHRYRVKTAVHFYFLFFIFSSIIPIGILVVVCCCCCCCCFLPLKGPSHINYVIIFLFFSSYYFWFCCCQFSFLWSSGPQCWVRLQLLKSDVFSLLRCTPKELPGHWTISKNRRPNKCDRLQQSPGVTTLGW